MALKQSKGFTAADDIQDLEPVEFELSWRLAADRKKTGIETFGCVDQVSVGVLIDLEANLTGAGFRMILHALLDDDHDLDVDGEPIDGTSSFQRYQVLTHDAEKETPAAEIKEVIQFLYDEYTARRNPARAASRPTTPSVPSAEPSAANGRSSTAAQRRRASTSGRSTQTVA